MQKKLIALAIAGLASGAAFADTSVTFGGIVDMGYKYSSDHTTPGIDSRSAMDDGGHDASRLWWKATEDLGNGLSVTAYQQLRMRADDRTAPYADSSYVKLEGKSWGAIRAGNYGSASDDINGFSEVGGMGYGNGVLDMITQDTTYNAVGYVSPNFGGIQAKLNYSTNDRGYNDLNGDSDINVRSVGGVVTYVANGLKLGGSYQVRSETDGLGIPKQTEWMLSGGYTFGQFMIGAGYDRENIDFANEVDRTAWRVNAGFAITPNDNVALSYTQLKYDIENANDLKAKGYGVSYSHAMSKRTNVYATYGKVSQSDSSAAYAGYESNFKLGLRHQF